MEAKSQEDNKCSGDYLPDQFVVGFEVFKSSTSPNKNKNKVPIKIVADKDGILGALLFLRKW